MPRLFFQDLDQDVFFSILCWCDIYAAISVGQTCRHLHNQVFRWSLWLVLLANLKRKLFLDSALADDIRDNVPVEGLIDLVKRILTGPETWSPVKGTGSFVPKVYKQIALHPAVHTGPGIREWVNEAKLLRGGDYVLFNNSRTLECWSVASDIMIWTHKSRLANASVVRFTAQVLDCGESAVIMLCETTYRADNPAKYVACLLCYARPYSRADRLSYISSIQLHRDRSSGSPQRHSDSLLVARAPSTSLISFSQAVISGDLAAVMITPGRHDLFLLNWKEKSALILAGNPASAQRMALIPHYIIVADPSDAKTIIHVISIDSIHRHFHQFLHSRRTQTKSIRYPSFTFQRLSSRRLFPMRTPSAGGTMRYRCPSLRAHCRMVYTGYRFTRRQRALNLARDAHCAATSFRYCQAEYRSGGIWASQILQGTGALFDSLAILATLKFLIGLVPGHSLFCPQSRLGSTETWISIVVEIMWTLHRILGL
ncbi:hypothetical protein C8J57DRAFT_175784 [Mycena rebaudengoi]|nr:hypothetical protein C8J57DRAFT_175784 [Mycena rebaudengoi]